MLQPAGAIEGDEALVALALLNENAPQIVIKHISNAREISVSSLTTPASDPPLLHGLLNPLPIPSKSLKAPRPATASAIFIGQNEDILTQILMGLPPKSLLRFQCVSKQWFSIISHSNFRRLHCRRYAVASYSSWPSAVFFSSTTGIVAGQLNSLSLRQVDVGSTNALTSRAKKFLHWKFWYLHSCNGLFCLNAYSIDPFLDPKQFVTGLTVYNVTTGQSRLIQWPEPEENYSYQDAHIAFDPVKSDYYKIVCLSTHHEIVDHYGFLVYSSETGHWSHAKETVDVTGDGGDPFFYSNKGVFWNGDLHWIGLDGSYLCFDLDNECIRKGAPSFPFSMSGWNVSYFGESGGRLCLIGLNDPQALSFDVMELERDYSRWVLKYHVDLNFLTTLYPSIVAENYDPNIPLGFRVHVPYFLVDEKEDETRLLISLGGMLVSYDINRMTVKDLAEVEPAHVQYHGKSVAQFKWTDACQYKETLAFV